jgi:hypothetical protein
MILTSLPIVVFCQAFPNQKDFTFIREEEQNIKQVFKTKG